MFGSHFGFELAFLETPKGSSNSPLSFIANLENNLQFLRILE